METQTRTCVVLSQERSGCSRPSGQTFITFCLELTLDLAPSLDNLTLLHHLAASFQSNNTLEPCSTEGVNVHKSVIYVKFGLFMELQLLVVFIHFIGTSSEVGNYEPMLSVNLNIHW